MQYVIAKFSGIISGNTLQQGIDMKGLYTR